MAKDLKSLTAQLANFGKAASAETSVSDPANKGEQSTAFPAERTIAPLPGQSASLDVPAVTPTEGAGEQKVEGGTATGVPGVTDFVQPATPETAKSAAGIIAGVGDLRSKLAAFGREAPKLETPEAKGKTPVQDAGGKMEDDEDKEAKEKAAGYVPGDYLMKVAFHLMQTTQGLAAVNSAMDEILGQEAATQLVKAAADEQANFLRDYTVSRLQQAEAEAEQMKQAAEYAELTRGATPEQLAAIENSSLLLKGAASLFADHPVGQLAAACGFEAAQKAAAAMEQGAPPEEAAAAAAQEGSGGEAEGPPNPQELEAALAALIEQKVITPEEAQQIMTELMAGGDPNAGGPPASEAGTPPADAGPPAKEAAVQQALAKIASTIFPG